MVSTKGGSVYSRSKKNDKNEKKEKNKKNEEKEEQEQKHKNTTAHVHNITHTRCDIDVYNAHPAERIGLFSVTQESVRLVTIACDGHVQHEVPLEQISRAFSISKLKVAWRSGVASRGTRKTRTSKCNSVPNLVILEKRKKLAKSSRSTMVMKSKNIPAPCRPHI